MNNCTEMAEKLIITKNRNEWIIIAKKMIDMLESEEDSKLSVKKYNKLRREIEKLPDDIGQIVCILQPLWNKSNGGRKTLSEYKDIKIMFLLMKYRSQGGDPEYLTVGAGAPNNCVLY